jgi:large subunit ribosomal protein L10
VAVTKVLVDFAREEAERVQVRAAVTSGELLDQAQIDALAKLPERPVLLAQLLALLQTPASLLVRLMQEPAAQMVRLLNQRAEQLKTQE